MIPQFKLKYIYIYIYIYIYVNYITDNSIVSTSKKYQLQFRTFNLFLTYLKKK